MKKVKVLLPNALQPFQGIVIDETTTHYCVSFNSLRPDLGEWFSKKFCKES